MTEPEMMGVSPLELYEAEFLAGRPSVSALEQVKADRLRIAALAEQVTLAAAENLTEMQRLRERAEQLSKELGGPNNADQR